jgi:predicted transposase/invertase (TIGR01784 family)
MHKKQDMKPLRDLNLTSRFLFDEVMEDREAHRDALSIIFGREIPLLDYSKTEQELRVSPLLRSIRMDVISMDEDLVIYNSEMQAKQKTDLAKRSRYYQALLDTNLLEPGIANYNLLNPSYIILITPFDLFGYKKYQYTFEPRCVEVPELKLEDGATRIFLNTRGENDADVSDELIEFLHYLEDTSDQRADETKSERIKRIHERVRKVKLSEKVGVKYMQAWEEKYYEREEGREEGLEAGRAQGRTLNRINLIQKKIRKGKSLEETADELEEEVTEISQLYDLVKANLEKNPEDILELLSE